MPAVKKIYLVIVRHFSTIHESPQHFIYKKILVLFINCKIYTKGKNIFRQTSALSLIVDNLINIIPIEQITFCHIINKLITSYPLEPVDK